MLRSISIERYKGMKKLEVPQLSPFTLIGGKNDIGKTSLLEAIFLFFDRKNPAALISHLAFRNAGTLDVTPETVWEPAFHDLNVESPIIIGAVDESGELEEVRFRVVRDHEVQQNFAPFSVAAEQAGVLQTQNLSGTALGVIAKRGKKELQDVYITVGVGGITSSGKVSSSVRRPATYLASARVFDSQAASRLTNVIIEKKEDKLLKVARLIDGRINKLAVGAVSRGQPYILAEVEGLPHAVPLQLLGGGATVAVNTALAIFSTPKGVVLIDELETGIHHSALGTVIDALHQLAVESGAQIIASTHSYECIKAAFEVFKGGSQDEFGYLRLERNKTGDVIAKSYSHETLSFALESEWEVR